ncbi:unnamed protein product [Brachionus calyciflorus]|uniref:Uncharacterized protein n=1 Tax=Brachionus calyciflorus TaxID=104777 RepID=A0A813QTW7_9BILA|nr:unnamed protein product [Brachionus calyciflorus]
MLSNLNRNDKCVCCLSGEDRIEIERSRQIDRELALLKRKFYATQKIVLLGAGESGKSTFLKQMQIIHGTGFTKSEITQYRTQIYENILKGIVGLINGKTELGLPWRGNDTQNSLEITTYMKGIIGKFRIIYKSLMDDREKQAQLSQQIIHILPEKFLSNNLVELIIELWNDLSIQEAYERRREFPRYFVENVPYFIENLNRIATLDYMPNATDILRARRATTSIHEIEINIQDVPFRFIDVGGQRTQRQKWQQCLSDVTAILFLASCSEFDECLREDPKKNRLEESCKVFETLINYKFLKNVEFILFLNKHDLLNEKIKRVNIKNYCSDFTGNPFSIYDVENYLVHRFTSLKRNSEDFPVERSYYLPNKTNKLNEFDSIMTNEYDDEYRHDKQTKQKKSNESEKKIYSHFTTAIDTNNIKTIFEMVRLMIFEKNYDEFEDNFEDEIVDALPDGDLDDFVYVSNARVVDSVECGNLVEDSVEMSFQSYNIVELKCLDLTDLSMPDFKLAICEIR